MASILNADTSNGLKLTSDTSGEIKLQSAGTDIVSVTANGMAVDTNTLYVDATNNRVGIGTSSPVFPLDVETSAATQVAEFTNTNASWAADFNIKYAPSGTDASLIGFSARSSGDAWLTTSYGSMLFRTGTSNSASEKMRISSTGNVYINTTSPQPTVNGFAFDTASNGYSILDVAHVSGALATGSYVRFFYGGSQIGRIAGASTSSVVYSTTSDYRLKENNVRIDNGIDRVKLLKPYRFNFIAEPDNVVDGFFAHEVQDVVPEAIIGTKDAMRTEEYEITPAVLNDMGDVVTEAVMGTREVPDYQGIDQSKLVPLLTAALQEAITKIEDLETRIQALENA